MYIIKLTMDERRTIIGYVVSIWIHAYDLNYWMEMDVRGSRSHYHSGSGLFFILGCFHFSLGSEYILSAVF